MKDAERIYALYVQANPVPDPDLLAETGDEAKLLTIERSEDMTTQEPIESQPVLLPRRRNALVAAGAFAAILVVGLVTVLLVNGGESGLVAAAARPEVVFDGATCTYDGPTQIAAGNVEYKIINSADELVSLTAFRMEGEALEAELLKIPVGTDLDVTGDPLPAGTMSFTRRTDPGSTETGVATFVPGTYLIDCGTNSGGGTDHSWRAARIDVVTP